MIPILYAADETNFNHNGIGALHETIDYLVTEQRNGSFELELEYPVTGQWFKDITDFKIILAKPNDTDEDHQFRIYETVKDVETESIHVFASTKTNDLGGNLVVDVTVTNETPQQAFNKLKANLVYPTDYNFVSDIQTTSSTHWERRNPLNCIAGESGSLTQYWGGEIKRTNDTIYLYSRRGTDNVTTIRPGKNLEGFTMTVSTKGMITAILPYFKYTPEGEDAEVTITGSVVNSPLINNYPVRYLIPVDYSGDETITDLATLNAEAASYFSSRNVGCDKPNVKIEVDLLQLSDSSEYADFKDLEHIELTDTVTVWVEKFDVDVEVKVVEIVYSGSKNQVINLTAGSESYSLYDDVRNTYMLDLDSKLQQYQLNVVNGVRNLINLSADGKNTVFRGYTEPDISISKLNDLWYKELGSGNVEMFQFDGAFWQSVKITDAVFAETMSITKFTAGTLYADLVNIVNMNADNITSGTVSGPNMSINLETGVIRVEDPITHDTLDFDQAKIVFAAGTTYERILSYTSEGWKLSPGPNNTGTNGNTSLIMEGGNGAHKYVDFYNTDWDTTQRIVGINETVRFHTNEQVEFRKNVHFDGQDDFNDVRAEGFYVGDGGEGIWTDINSFTNLDGWNGVRLNARGTSYVDVYIGGIEFYAPLYMNGYAIWDQSDVDLKTNILPANVDAIAETKRQKVIEFEWDKTLPENKRKPEGRQFGLSAQDAGILQIPAEENGTKYLGVNLSKEVHLATLTNQQLIAKMEALEARIAKLEKGRV